jgi:hypothetical protein
VSEPEQNVAISFELDVPHEAVSGEELDLIEAHFSPLIRQLLTEIALLEE